MHALPTPDGIHEAAPPVLETTDELLLGDPEAGALSVYASLMRACAKAIDAGATPGLLKRFEDLYLRWCEAGEDDPVWPNAE